MSKYYKEKEFVCKKCGADFKKKRQLKQHMEDKHGLSLGGCVTKRGLAIIAHNFNEME